MTMRLKLLFPAIGVFISKRVYTERENETRRVQYLFYCCTRLIAALCTYVETRVQRG